MLRNKRSHCNEKPKSMAEPLDISVVEGTASTAQLLADRVRGDRKPVSLA